MDGWMSLHLRTILLCPNLCHVEITGLVLDDGEFVKLSRSAGLQVRSCFLFSVLD